ncbi:MULTISPECIES: ATP-binding protein [unclassified Breznakia]|uniref:ATP-binding protein n=1 Tax=unclassified Breznakia TaxID=2623764 RepID=UPI002406D4AE|nr:MULTISPECIES: ATP-binding protein [unclassified Breznakia]MDF9838704.1 primosomal protein DnaI [Breznakia sp. PFB2-8]MDF9860735.1 primosomal protein DnaI [Breznakia sp. PH5-24]
MEKFKFDIKMNDELQKEKDDLCRKLLNNKHIQSFLKEYDLQETFVYHNTYVLNDYLKRISLCDECPGLVYCKQEVKGYVLSLQLQNEDVEKVLRPCQFLVNLENAIAHQEHLILNDMSEEQMQYRLSNINLENETKSYIELYRDMTKDVIEMQNKGFFICGDPGVGKTYLTCCYINELAKKTMTCGFVHVPTLIADLKTLMYDNAAFKKVIYNLRRVDVLMLDDIGGESASTWSRDDILLPLLNDRMENRRKTLFTSNFNFHEIEEFYRLKSKAINDKIGANRLVERMKSLADEKVLKGNNRRVENSSN